jgi:hypothetical protein
VAVAATSRTFIATGEFHFRESALCEVGVSPIYTSRFHCAGRKVPNSLHEKTLASFCDRSAQEITGCSNPSAATLGKDFSEFAREQVAKTTEFVVRTESEEFRAQVLSGFDGRTFDSEDGRDAVWLQNWPASLG